MVVDGCPKCEAVTVEAVMTLRRYSPLKPSSGTRWPPEVRQAIWERDGGVCAGIWAGFPDSTCHGFPMEIDHVRASHAMGMKSPSTTDNGVLLCGNHHRWKTEHGREARPLLLHYLERFA